MSASFALELVEAGRCTKENEFPRSTHSNYIRHFTQPYPHRETAVTVTVQ